MKSIAVSAIIGIAQAAVPADRVTSIPGFAATNFNTYSGYLDVPGPIKGTDYDSILIPYIFNEARSDPSTLSNYNLYFCFIKYNQLDSCIILFCLSLPLYNIK